MATLTVISGAYLADGRIDFMLRGDLGDGCVTDFPFTLDPKETDPATLGPAGKVVLAAAKKMKLKVAPYVWAPPTRDDLLARLKKELRRTGVDDYVAREISTGGAEKVPESVALAATFARAAYNRFKDALPDVPQDWADARHWQAE